LGARGSTGPAAKRRRILDAAELASALQLIAEQVATRSADDARSARAIATDRLALVGIRTGGEHLAHRLATRIERLRGAPVDTGVLDITLYRDDALLGGRLAPKLQATEIPFDVEGRSVVLVDDVLFTGRTVRAALDALLDMGRPACVRLAVAVDRGLRELPIAPDFVGRLLHTTPQQRVVVALTETGADEDAVWLEERA
jgi:pyrimidine operon attenuation protein/uracil phosphoribosyltransferase